MSHDAWASFTAIELARDCIATPLNWFTAQPAWEYQTYATRDPSRGWPHPDGVVEVAPIGDADSHVMALEFKRANEGVHGVLTGLGQVQAYLHKGFSASVLVVPETYDTLEDAGAYARAVIDQAAGGLPLGVFSYREPDLSSASPFSGRIRCCRPVRFDPDRIPAPERQTLRARRQRTQWAHVREGSTVPDPIFRFLQASRDTAAAHPFVPQVLPQLQAAVRRLLPTGEVVDYLSNSSNARPFADAVWKRFWFSWVLTPAVQRLFVTRTGTMVPDASATGLLQWDGSPIVFFGARGDSIKPRLVRNVTEGQLSRGQAWERFAENIRNRAHQFREDIDSGAEAAGFIDQDGRLTDLGFRFVTICERTGRANDPQPIALLRWALLTNGGFLALLHYIHAVSDEAFRSEPLRFTDLSGTPRFESTTYRDYLLDRLANDLRVAATASRRPGRRRPPFEAEFITLRKLGLVENFRSGIGLEINWPSVHEALDTVA